MGGWHLLSGWADSEMGLWILRDNGFLAVQVEALRNQQDLSRHLSIALFNNDDALPKKNTAAKVSFSERSWINIFHLTIQQRIGRQ